MKAILTISVVFVSIAVVFIAPRVFNHIPFIYETEKCPFCYGNSFCNNISSISLRFSSVSDIVNNLFSIKNVYFTTEKVVLKKLSNSKELQRIDQFICKTHKGIKHCELNKLNLDSFDYQELFESALKQSNGGYKICGDRAIDIFTKRLQRDKNLDFKKLWTVSLTNFEPLFYKVFDGEAFNLPKYYGECGRFIVVEDCGSNLNTFENHDWYSRALIARSIIDVMMKFTEGDDDFRIYLTDISPDNIAVDSLTFQAKFVDFGNVILVKKRDLKLHQSEDFPTDEGFAFNEDEICDSTRSDHNIYSICKLLFSYNAPWPMMNEGLLHSIPDDIQAEYPDLVQIIASCVQPPEDINRFEVVKRLDHSLENILQMRPV